MIEGTTRSGFHFEIDEDVFDDYFVLDALARIDKGDFTGLHEGISAVLGERDTDRLINHVKADKKRVSATAMIAEFGEILNAAKELSKN